MYHDDAVVARSAGLLDVAAFRRSDCFDGFAVNDFLVFHVNVDLEHVLHPIGDVSDVDHTLSTDQKLAGFFVSNDLERDVFQRQFGERVRKFVFVGFVFGMNRDIHRRCRNDWFFKIDRRLFVADR